MEEQEKSVYLKDVEYFSAKVEQNPSSTLFVPLANAYIKLEQYDEAVSVLKTGIDENPEVYAAKTMLAQAYMGQGDVDEAKVILTGVLATDSHNYLACKLMGDLFRNEENIKKALVNYRNALMVAPEDTKLRALMDELMEAAGISAGEISAEPNLMDADDELLDQLGSELAEEVRQEVGEEELGKVEASDDEISSTVDSIVGVDDSSGMEDMSLDNYQESSSAGAADELEEELVASFDDEIIHTDLSPDEMGEEDVDKAVKLDKEIMGDGTEAAPDDDEVAALAAELGADLGLETKSALPPDDIDEALDEVFGEEKEKTEEEKSFFDGVDAEAPEELDDELKAMLGVDEAVAETETVAEEPVAEEAVAEESVAEEAIEEPAVAEPELDDDLKALLGEDVEPVAEEPVAEEAVEEPAVAEPELDDDLKALLGEDVEPVAEEAVAEEAVEEPAVAEPELDDDLKALLGEDVEPVEEAVAEEAVEEPAVAEPELDDDLKALLGEDIEPVEDTVEAEAEHVAELQDIEDLEGFEPVSEDAEIPAEDEEPEEADAHVEMLTDAEEESPDVSETSEEIYEASMDELMENAPEDDENGVENLDPETREQVNRLENLLETIKNNASN
ncbi:MAG: tetratricopeptide repeat protein [Deferribacterales bacterium]